MSVVVRPASEADIEGVCDLLHTHMSAKIFRERWRLLLDYPWRPLDADRGQLAVDGDRVVGFLGLVYADRIIDGETHRFCNICAWYLHKDYRGRGIGQEIQRQSIADSDMTYTLVTATASTDRAFRQAGFEISDTERYCLRRSHVPPHPEEPRSGVSKDQRTDHALVLRDGPLGPPQDEGYESVRGSSATSFNGLGLIEGAEAIEGLITPAERQILRHHRAFNLRHLLFRAAGQSCYLVLQNRKKGADINYHQALYVGAPDFLSRHGQDMADLLLDGGNSLFAVDRRFVSRHQPWTTEPIAQPRLYRSGRLKPHQIDNLYSEVPLLDLKLP